MIDSSTAILLAGLMSGLMAMVLFALRRTYPPSIHGLGTWSVGLLGVTLGTLLAFNRDWLPGLSAISMARVLLLASLYLIYWGTLQFVGLRPRLKVWIPVLLTGTLLQVLFTHGYPSFHARLMVATSLAAVCS